MAAVAAESPGEQSEGGAKLAPGSGQGSLGGTSGFLVPPSPGRRNAGRRRRRNSSDFQAFEREMPSPGRDSAVSRLTDRKRDELPISFQGSVEVIKYSLMSFYTPLSLMITYTIFHAMPATELHRVGIAQRAAVTVMMSERKKQRARTRKMLTKYKVYNFQPLAAAAPTTQSVEGAIQALMSDSRVSTRRRLAPDAAAAMVTYTTLYPWRMKRHKLRKGSVAASSNSVDDEPFLSEHTTRRLSLTAAEVAAVRSPSLGAVSGGSMGKGGFALPPARSAAKQPFAAAAGSGSGASKTGKSALGAGRASAVGRSRSVVDLQSSRASTPIGNSKASPSSGSPSGTNPLASLPRHRAASSASKDRRGSPVASTGRSPRVVRYHPSLDNNNNTDSPTGQDSPVPLAAVGDSLGFPMQAPAAKPRVARIRARPQSAMMSPQGGTGQAAQRATAAPSRRTGAGSTVVDASGSTGAS